MKRENTISTSHLRKLIEAKKQKLIREARENGLHENFGQVEVRQLKDKIGSEEFYGEKGSMINAFDDWVSTLSLEDL